MATKAGVGRSAVRGSFAAGVEAARGALQELDGQADFVLVFATTGHNQPEILSGVREVVGDTPISGCSAEGVITLGESAEKEQAIAVMAIRSTSIRFHNYFAGGYGESVRCAEELAKQVNGNLTDDAQVLLVLPDGLVGNCTDFLASLHQKLSIPVAVCGGAASDNMKFDKTYQYHDGTSYSAGVSAILVSGAAHVEIAASHGCAPIGLTRTVTKSNDGWVYEIDGQPTWELFKEYLHGDPQDLNAEGIVHLCIGEPLDADHVADYDPYIIRTPMTLDKATGALFFPGGGLLEGAPIRLTRRDPAKIKESAAACAQRILHSHPNRRPDLVLQFDCAGRGSILFGSCAAAQIVTPLQEVLGNATPWIGFHTYGEIAPLGDTPHYHNYTVALCAIYDDEQG